MNFEPFLNNLNVILAVLVALFAVFQGVFFRKSVSFPIKPSYKYAIKFVENRLTIVVIIMIVYYGIQGILFVWVLNKYGIDNIWLINLGGIILGTGLTIAWQIYVIVPLNVQCIRSFFCATGYDQKDFEKLFLELENSVEDNGYIKETICDSLGILDNFNK
jgi:hypothetical protein